MRLKDKVIIITGSTQGIGFKTAEILLKKGACVIINSRRKEKVESALEKLKKISPNVEGIYGDVSDENFSLELCDFSIQKFGRLDVLINNAGIAAGGTLLDTKGSAFKKVIDINLLGSLYPTLACLNEIRKNKGGILFIGSVAGVAGLPSYSAYSSSKRALVSIAESLRIELFDEGVFVGIHYPGFTENEEDKTILNGEGEEKVLRKRDGVKAQSREKTASAIVRQLERKKFRSFSSLSAAAVHKFYRLSPSLFMRLMIGFRKRIMAMQ